MLGKIVVDGADSETVPFEDPNTRNLVAEVSCKASHVLIGKGIIFRQSVYLVDNLSSLLHMSSVNARYLKLCIVGRLFSVRFCIKTPACSLST